MKVKFNFHDYTFFIVVPRSIEYTGLVERVGRKIRLTGAPQPDDSLRLKYTVDDGDIISLASTEDVQMAFEQCPPDGHITLFVTGTEHC
jgi:cell division control protein 24